MTRRSLLRATVLTALLTPVAVSGFAPRAFAQGGAQSATAAGESRPGPAPRRDLSGTWAPAGSTRDGIQAGGVQAMPNDGRPEHELPYTAYGREVYESHRALEGIDAVLPAEHNDPRNRCEPIGFPRMNHYNIRMTQIFQNPYKLAVLYQYDNRWRNIWIDGRELPELVDGGVIAGGTYKASKWYGYSVGEWVDDYTLVVKTVGIMPEDRIWLDSTGRPISDMATITEEFRRIDSDHLRWTETIDDPKIYTEPWVSMSITLRQADPHTDVIEMYCSPVEM
ncbi:MAG TPA: hypothetical protein VIV14_09685, partial [Gammaproteobacteria bacterium]